VSTNIDRPAALRTLAVYKAGNFCLGGATLYVLAVISLSFFTYSPALCILTSVDILLFPFIFGEKKNTHESPYFC
jgi:hypothetical protein